MWEFLVVRYWRRRRVYVDGTRFGLTNTTLRVAAGPHRIDLGEPKNYQPGSRRVDLDGTSAARPEIIEFEPEDSGE